MINTTVAGFYPKIAEDSAVPNYRAARNRLDHGKITEAEFETIVQSTIERAVSEQFEAGIDLPTDGQIPWDDLVTPFAQAWNGMQVGGLIRFFDNNVYYRRARIEGEPRVADPVAAAAYRRGAAAARGSLKGVLPGPLTFVRMSDDHFFGDFGRALAAVARALNREALALEQAGCRQLQIDEPHLGREPEAVDACAQALRTMLKGVTMHTSLAVYFHALPPLLPALWHLPVDGFFLDCVSRPENLEVALGAPADRAVVFGIADARNTGREAPAYLRETLERIAQRRVGCENWVAPNAQLEFLPHADLQLKLRDLTAAVASFNRQAQKG